MEEDKGEEAFDEIYKGVNSRPSLLVRMDKVERALAWLVYVSTTLFVSTLVGAGGVIFYFISK